MDNRDHKKFRKLRCMLAFMDIEEGIWGPVEVPDLQRRSGLIENIEIKSKVIEKRCSMDMQYLLVTEFHSGQNRPADYGRWRTQTTSNHGTAGVVFYEDIGASVGRKYVILLSYMKINIWHSFCHYFRMIEKMIQLLTHELLTN